MSVMEGSEAMRVGWIQTNPIRADKAANLAGVEPILVSGDADLWVLPELFSTGYLFADRGELSRLAEPVPSGRTTEALIRLAEKGRCSVVAGIAEQVSDGRLFNAAVMVDGSGLLALYRKIHLFDLEKEWFDPGDRPYPVVTLSDCRVGVMICFDWRFPEAARTLALAGAQVIAHPANLVMPHCQQGMVTRALENRVFTVTANRVGTEEVGGNRVEFTGASRIVSPDGGVLSDGPREGEAFDVVNIEPGDSDDKMINSRNDLLADRRPEFYPNT